MWSVKLQYVHSVCMLSLISISGLSGLTLCMLSNYMDYAANKSLMVLPDCVWHGQTQIEKCGQRMSEISWLSPLCVCICESGRFTFQADLLLWICAIKKTKEKRTGAISHSILINYTLSVVFHHRSPSHKALDHHNEVSFTHLSVSTLHRAKVYLW